MEDRTEVASGTSSFRETYFLDIKTPNMWGLRADYYSYDERNGPLSTSLGFFQSSPQVLRILKQFAKDQDFLLEELARVKARFNPLAAMKGHPEEVEKISYSKEAIQRERAVPKLAAAARENKERCSAC
jgi:endo-1,4-beta-D-glucanase Y